MTDKVLYTCAKCGRQVPLDVVARDAEGNPVVIWHMRPDGSEECPNSWERLEVVTGKVLLFSQT